jgi:hypothetical protein
MCNAGMSFLEGAVSDVVPVAAGAIAIPIIPIPITIFIGVTVAVYSAVAYIELSREDYRDYLACGMFEALKGEVTTTQDGFDAAFDNLPVRPPPSETGGQDLVRDIIEKWFRAVVNDLENYLAFVSVLGTAMNAAANLTFTDCPCGSCVQDAWNLDGFLPARVHVGVDPIPPVLSPPNNDGDGGIWKVGIGQTGDGIESTVTGISNFINCSIRIELDPSCTVTQVRHFAKYGTGGAARWRILSFHDAAGALVHSVFAGGITPSGNWELRDTGAISVSGASWLFIFEESRTTLDPWVRVDDLEISYS